MGHSESIHKNAIDYKEPVTPKFKTLAINQQPMPASKVETRAVIKQREDKDDEDFTLAIQTTFEKEWQTQLQHEIQKVKQYLWQLLVPQYTLTLTENEKEAIIQAILTHLRLHEELPTDLLMTSDNISPRSMYPCHHQSSNSSIWTSFSPHPSHQMMKP